MLLDGQYQIQFHNIIASPIVIILFQYIVINLEFSKNDWWILRKCFILESRLFCFFWVSMSPGVESLSNCLSLRRNLPGTLFWLQNSYFVICTNTIQGKEKLKQNQNFIKSKSFNEKQSWGVIAILRKTIIKLSWYAKYCVYWATWPKQIMWKTCITEYTLFSKFHSHWKNMMLHKNQYSLN